MAYKILMNRLRKTAERQGYCLHKSRTRDPRALKFNQFQIVNGNGRAIFVAHSVEAVETFLMGAPSHG